VTKNTAQHDQVDPALDERRRSGEVPRTYRPTLDQRALRLIARIQHNPSDVSAVLALKEHYTDHHDFPSLANLLQGWANTVSSDRAAADAYVEAAEAVVIGIGDTARAQSLYACALQRYPQHGAALQKLELLLREADDDAGLERCFRQVADALAKRSAAPQLRASLHYRLGQHYQQRLEEPDSAIAQYRTALDLDPTFTPAITAAHAMYLERGDAPAAAQMLELQVAASTDPVDRHALLQALARHRREACRDLDGSVEALQRAIEISPTDAGDLEWLAELLHERAERDSSEVDWARAADCYYQAARYVPRTQAHSRLAACLAMRPDHWRARRMLAELNAYGAQADALPSCAQLSQAQVDDKTTGVHELPAAPPLQPVVKQVSITAISPPSALPNELAPDDRIPWLEEDALTPLEEERHGAEP
jgi:tetratricopeptide (TPR) repeat protein